MSAVQGLDSLWAAIPLQDTGQVVVRLGIATALGGVVALLYWLSRDPGARTPGFAHTLVLLAPLITMVTIAVGDNIAAAFTLVGTLAIVRFRTAVRDSRDMAFVIFAVAVGMALGALNLVVAFVGVVVVGGTVLLLRQIERRRPELATGVLRLVISPPEADPSVYAPTLSRFAQDWTVQRSAIDRKEGVLELRLAIGGLDPKRSPVLLAELLQLPDVVRASFSPEEPE
jgi:hypothetical protein